MKDYTTLDTPALIEMLINRTAYLTGKIAERGIKPADLTQYEYEISLLQAELRSRKITESNTSVSESIKIIE